MNANILLNIYDKILKVNLTDDSYTIIKYDADLEKDFVSNSRSFSDWLSSFALSGNVYSEDLSIYKKYTSLSYLRGFFRNNNNHWVQYRRRYGDKFRWCEMLMLTAEDYTDDDQYIYLFVKRLNEISNDDANEGFFVKSKKILIVHDNMDDRDCLAAIVREVCDVLVADSKESASNLLREHYEDVLAIIGHIGNDDTIIKYIELLRNNSRYDSIPIIIATGSYSQKKFVKFLENGAFDIIVKPYNQKLIINKINNLAKLKYSMLMLDNMKIDPLTGLYSKQFFFQRVEELLEINPDKSYRMICTNIEQFRLINESHGAELGDKTLAYIAEHITDVLPNVLVGGRLSGDVFAFFRENIPFKYNNDVWKKFRESAPVPNLVIKYGLSTVDRSLSVQTMCDHAIEAAKSIKQVYGIPFAEYTHELQNQKQREKLIVDHMDEAIANNQFELYYQPKLDLIKNEIGGAEALIRWTHPKFGFLNPAEFIPLFEKNGFISELDIYVFKQVCKDVREWLDKGYNVVPVSINLSRRDFENPTLSSSIFNIMKDYDINPDLIHFEITESAFSSNIEQISNIIARLRERGCIIELDDFGSGYSSLTNLNNMQIDILKIDKSILNEDSNKDNKVLQFCIQLAKILELRTVVEGVENKNQLDELKEMGCDSIQGYYYSKPVPKADFIKFLQ